LANAISFGSIDTRLTAIRDDQSEDGLGLGVVQQRRFAAQTALRRIGTVEEASGAIYFLASDDSTT
jgi:NAD(P)-dependent dehydrogenase (short-subunit alcohol dehydrogenase family)